MQTLQVKGLIHRTTYPLFKELSWSDGLFVCPTISGVTGAPL